MLIAHGPGAFLATWLGKKLWYRKQLSDKQVSYLFIFSFLMGVLVDLDLLWYYFVNANFYHRESITHTLIFWLVVFAILFIIGLIAKKVFLKSFAIVLLITSLSHLILDSIVGYGIAWLWPLSERIWGIGSIPLVDQGWYGENGTLMNVIFEFFVISIFIGVLFYCVWGDSRKLKATIVALALLFGATVYGLVYANQFTYHSRGSIAYGDLDHDGIMNKDDLDMDGDGTPNIGDDDANNNGKNNCQDVEETYQKVKIPLNGFSDGGFYEIPRRLGLLTDIDRLYVSYNAAGIFLEKEMREDYNNNPHGYKTSTNDYRFTHDVDNLNNFLNRRDIKLCPSFQK